MGFSRSYAIHFIMNQNTRRRRVLPLAPPQFPQAGVSNRARVTPGCNRMADSAAVTYTVADFSCCHWNAKSATLATI
jgi:hypothetical protein